MHPTMLFSLFVLAVSSRAVAAGPVPVTATATPALREVARCESCESMQDITCHTEYTTTNFPEAVETVWCTSTALCDASSIRSTVTISEPLVVVPVPAAVTATVTNTFTATVIDTISATVTDTVSASGSAPGVVLAPATVTITDVLQTYTNTMNAKTSTITTTLFFETATETAPAPAGFRPIQDTLPGLLYDPSQRGWTPMEPEFQARALNGSVDVPLRAEVPSHAAGSMDISARAGSRHGLSRRAMVHPAAVTCTVHVPSSDCGSPAAPPAIVRLWEDLIEEPVGTVTETEIVTMVYSSTTVTVTEHVTSTGTTTDQWTDGIFLEVKTEIDMDHTTTTTVYPACATSNFGNILNSNGIGALRGDLQASEIEKHDDITGTYDCCALAFSREYPVAAWGWGYMHWDDPSDPVPESGLNKDRCYIIKSLHDCDAWPGHGLGGFPKGIGVDQEKYGMTVGNGPCGSVDYVNRFPPDGGNFPKPPKVGGA